MANYEQQPGQFTLFKNAKKTESKHPDVKGDGLNLDGVAIEVAGWIARNKDGEIIKDKNGNTIINGRISLKTEKLESKKPEPIEGPEDDLPF